MSIEMINRAFAVEGLTGAAECAVLVALAHEVREGDTCWPAMATIAKKAKLGLSRAREVVAALEAAGLIQRVTRTGGVGPDGRGRSNLYRLLLCEVVAEDELAGDEAAVDNPAAPEADAERSHRPAGDTTLGKPPAERRDDVAEGTGRPVPNLLQQQPPHRAREAEGVEAPPDAPPDPFLAEVRAAAGAEPDRPRWEDHRLAIEVERWRVHGLTRAEMLAEIRRVAKWLGAPPDGPQYFGPVFRNFAEYKSQPKPAAKRVKASASKGASNARKNGRRESFEEYRARMLAFAERVC